MRERSFLLFLIFTVRWRAALWEVEAEHSRCGIRICTVVSRSRSTCWFSVRQALRFTGHSWDGLRQSWNVVTQKLNVLNPIIFSKWYFKFGWYLTTEHNTIRPNCWVRQLMFNKEIIILFPDNHTNTSAEWKNAWYIMIQMSCLVIIAVT